jgi:hypothetical protein
VRAVRASKDQELMPEGENLGVELSSIESVAESKKTAKE